MNKTVFVVIDSQGSLLGVFKKYDDALAESNRHCYFCRIEGKELK